MIDSEIRDNLVRASRLLGDWHYAGLQPADFSEILAAARECYDTAERLAASDDAETAATIGIGRATAAWCEFQFRFDEDSFDAWDFESEYPEIGAITEDVEEVTRASAEHAVEAARAAWDADAANALVPWQLGQVRAWLGDRDGAVAALEEVLRRAPWDDYASTCLSGLGVDIARPEFGTTQLPYDFVRLTEVDCVGPREDDGDVRCSVFGSVDAARAYVDWRWAQPVLDFGSTVELTLEIDTRHQPFQRYDLLRRMSDDSGVDWADIPFDALEAPLPPGRITRYESTCFFLG